MGTALVLGVGTAFAVVAAIVLGGTMFAAFLFFDVVPWASPAPGYERCFANGICGGVCVGA